MPMNEFCESLNEAYLSTFCCKQPASVSLSHCGDSLALTFSWNYVSVPFAAFTQFARHL